MKKLFALFAVITAISILFASCGTADTPTGSETETEAVSVPAETVEDPTNDELIATGEFTVSPSSGVTVDGNTYTVTAAGEYTFKGALDGSIVVDAGDEDEVVLIFDGVTLASSDTAPVYVKNAGEVSVKSAEGSYNTVTDSRAAADSSASDGNTDGNAAIWSDCDLKINGKGTLIVTSSYDNGIKSKDDLTVKNVTLKVTSPGVALKGNDSVEIKSGSLTLVSTEADGIKTSNTDVSSKGNQRGTVTISGGNISVYSACDGISAAYDVVINEAEAAVNLNVYTADYAAESGAGAVSETESSSKGIKAENAVLIEAGIVTIYAMDDGVHANADSELDNGGTPEGKITVSGGSLTITAADDGLHADGDLIISGGAVNVAESHEGLEGNVISIEGGAVTVYGNDDGMNACKGTKTPEVNISGGTVTVTTPSGDTDAIDSNGNFVMSGGFVIVRGGAAMGGMAGSIDVDGSISVTGGTILAFGGICEIPSGGGGANVYASSGTNFSAGDYTLTDSSGNTIASFTLDKSYSSLWIASDALALNGSYTLSLGNSAVLSWTQSSAQEGDQVSGGFGPGGGGPGGGFAPPGRG
ncbi:MAG: carbohydrate-binding domain-containing protein [Clostridia bacterium]|nr:carbohydrate-binding domain-containing protein [Clostridia bacterium]